MLPMGSVGIIVIEASPLQFGELPDPRQRNAAPLRDRRVGVSGDQQVLRSGGRNRAAADGQAAGWRLG
jgi:hypothetical protein